MGWILFLVWAVGWLVAIYPVYRGILREWTKSNNRHSLSISYKNAPSDCDPIDADDVAACMALATLAAAIWPVAAPIYISRFLWKHDVKLDVHTDRLEAADELHAKVELEHMMKEAAKELEPANKNGFERHNNDAVEEYLTKLESEGKLNRL